jgi:hypothetical protein
MEAQGKALQAGRLPRPTSLSDNVPPERLTGYETCQTVTTKKKKEFTMIPEVEQWKHS